MSAFDELERQLLASVEVRSRARRRELLGGLPGWWRERFGMGALALAVSLAIASGVLAMWAGAPHGSGSPVRLDASVAETGCTPCQAFGGQLHSRPAQAAAVAVEQPQRTALDRRGPSVVRWAVEEESGSGPGQGSAAG